MKTPIPTNKISYNQVEKAIDMMRDFATIEMNNVYTVQELAAAIGAVLPLEMAEFVDKRPVVTLHKVDLAFGHAVAMINSGPEMTVKNALGSVKLDGTIKLYFDPRPDTLILAVASGIKVNLVLNVKREIKSARIKIDRVEKKVVSAEVEV